MTVFSAEDTEHAASSDGVRAALRAAAEVVGPDRVTGLGDTDPAGALGPNISLFRSRRVAGVVRPRTAEQTRQVVEIFGGSADAGSLHAFSTGRNWGLGSREPAGDGAVVLDLGDVDRVRDLDVAAGWAVVEPGVTQGRLAELLADTDRMINVTVSSAHTSFIGNSLDRGVGLRHQRVDDVVGLEVALPGGELVHVGWWPDPERPTPVYPHGLGPSLVQFFAQSNFGVVTAAAIRLLPRPEALRVVRLNFPPAKVAEAVTEMRRWVSQGLTRGVLKVYNPAAAAGYGSTPGQFLAHVCVDGTAAAVEALTGIVVAEATASGLFSEVSATDGTDPDSPHHVVAGQVEGAYAGDPDVTDGLFEAKMGQRADRLDHTNGFLFFLPLVPFAGPAIARVEVLLEQVFAETGIRCGATLNALGPDLIDCVVAMKFDRGAADVVASAHQALDMLYRLFREEGFVPYRLDVDHADWIDRFTPDTGAREFVRRLRDAIDPNRAIAPGRYR